MAGWEVCCKRVDVLCIDTSIRLAHRVAARQRIVYALDLDGHPAFQKHVNLCAYHVAMARLLGDLREHGRLRISISKTGHLPELA